MAPTAGELTHLDPEGGTALVRFPAHHPPEEAIAAAALGLTGRAWILLDREDDGAIRAQITLRDLEGVTIDARRGHLEALAGELLSAATWQSWAHGLRSRHRDRLAEVYRRALGGGTP